MLIEEISENHALNSDYGGDADVKDEPPIIMDRSSSSQTSDKESISVIESSTFPKDVCASNKQTFDLGSSNNIDVMKLPPSTSGLSNSSQCKSSRHRQSRGYKESLATLRDSDPDDLDNDPTYEPNPTSTNITGSKSPLSILFLALQVVVNLTLQPVMITLILVLLKNKN